MRLSQNRARRLLIPLATVFILLCCQLTIAASIKVNSTSAHSQTMPAIAARGDNVAVIWQSDANYHLEVMAAVSRDGGRTFSPEVRLAGAENEIHREPVVAWGPGGELYVAWQAVTDDLDYDVLLSVSSDGGRTFSPPIRVNFHKEGNQLFPTIAVAPSGSVHVAWHDNRDSPGFYHIYAVLSDDVGKTFTKGRRISGEADRLNLWPSIWAGENRVVVAWQGSAAGGFEIFIAASSDGGETFSEPVSPPGRDGRDRQFADIAMTEDGLQVVWSEKFIVRRPPGDRAYRHSSNQHDIQFSLKESGLGFSTPTRINGLQTGQQLRPDILPVGGRESVVAWFDGRSVADFDIYVASGSGEQFDPERRVNETENSDSRNPRVALSGDSVVVVWQDDSEGNYEIYCARIPLDSLR